MKLHVRQLTGTELEEQEKHILSAGLCTSAGKALSFGGIKRVLLLTCPLWMWCVSRCQHLVLCKPPINTATIFSVLTCLHLCVFALSIITTLAVTLYDVSQQDMTQFFFKFLKLLIMQDSYDGLLLMSCQRCCLPMLQPYLETAIHPNNLRD